MTRCLTVGLTGGIASGKSEVGRAFERLGVPIIDADVVARDIVAPGQPALAEIAKRFGEDVLAADGSLQRRALREIVFDDEAARRDLEAITHPRIREELARRRDAADGEYCMLVVPLLIKTGMDTLADRILVVDAPRELQLQRLVARDEINLALANNMIDAQDNRAQRLAVADDVLVNTGARADIADLAAALHAGYARLARGEIDTLPPMHLPG